MTHSFCQASYRPLEIIITVLKTEIEKHRTKETILVLGALQMHKGCHAFRAEQTNFGIKAVLFGWGFFLFNPYTHIILMIKIRNLNQQMPVLIL